MALLRVTTEHPLPGQAARPGRFARRVSLSLVAMALLTGAGLRIYRTIVLQYGWSDRWSWIAGTFVIGAVFLFLMATLHLGNYPVKSWTWRAPTFAVLEALTEIAVSLGLTLAGLEKIGSLTATLEDWQGTSMRILFFRLAGITLFALALGVVSTVARLILLPRKHTIP
ncbi:MAG: hypothetical protein ACYC0B_00920 [Gemmatimonadaceae bacterium]